MPIHLNIGHANIFASLNEAAIVIRHPRSIRMQGKQVDRQCICLYSRGGDAAAATELLVAAGTRRL
jgi:hypothetical protein